MFRIDEFKPLMDKVLTTANRYESSIGEDGLVEDGKTEGYIKEYQTVLAVAEGTPSSIKVGDTVLINPTNYMRPVHTSNGSSVMDKDSVEMVVNFPIITVRNQECLLLTYRDFDGIVKGEEIPTVIE